MLKLKRVDIQGFKSFYDRTDMKFHGSGIAAIVGPNGCGKSNISDAISWVLGEQSAKSLRGTRMEDVIFAGTRERKPLGMAQVTLTMMGVDPLAHSLFQNEPGRDLGDTAPKDTASPAVSEDVVITRRLYRSGESEYLVNGKSARLRDIQDLFSGTGLGPESYAIIEQGRIGQILSNKPADRRAIIEEAAGIGKYKTRKRLAESKLESSRQNLARVFDILEECAARGVPFATVYSAGFAESGTQEGRDRQAKLVAFARRTGMRIMGPNCNGVINFVDRFAMASTGAIGGPRKPAGNVGVVSHSGGLGQINVMWRAQEIGLGISYEASVGNEADLDSLDFARFMLRSEATDVILMAIEGVKDGAKLIALAREAAEREKPIVVLKFGRTAAGIRAAASHTGTIAGADDIYDAAFRQYGMIRVSETNELYEMAVLLRTRRWPKGRGTSSAAATGGNIVQLADVGEQLGIEWPEYAPQTQAKLAELMPGYGKVSNPTDMTSLATGEPENFRRALTAIAEDPSVDTITPIFAFVLRQDIERGAEFVRTCAKPAAMLWVGGCTDDASFGAKDLVAAGVPVYRNALPCLRAVRAAADFGALVAEHKAGRRNPSRPADADAAAARKVLAAVTGPFTEREAKQMLTAYGFAATREFLARSADDAVAHARTLDVPVAIKIDSPDIPHKTEAGAIRLRVQGDEAVRQAYAEVVAAARSYAPNATVNGALVQEMAPAGTEMMLGVLRDPVFGPVVAAGLGGIHVEVLRDIAYRIAPITAAEAAKMLRELRGYKLLEGVRGAPPADVDALVATIVRLSWFAHDFADAIAELDINPLLVFGRGAGVQVVDALIVRPG